MGHEAVGEVVEVGKGVGKFKVGDKVFSPFHLSCGESLSGLLRVCIGSNSPFEVRSSPLTLTGDCFYCHRGYFSRCVQAQCIGGPGIEGAQAEYLRVPLADATLLPTPPDMPEELMLLMADILPTGYSVAWHARRLADEDREPLGAAQEKDKGGVCVVVGCGPVSRGSRGS
jgi:threonine dehydrogenase-like Zn-dependent dehydrogenase